MFPIVVPALGNPVALGLIETEARPGGNLTGIMPYVKGLPAKQLELAREIGARCTEDRMRAAMHLQIDEAGERLIRRYVANGSHSWPMRIGRAEPNKRLGC
jgi:hypothetical protein